MQQKCVVQNVTILKKKIQSTKCNSAINYTAGQTGVKAPRATSCRHGVKNTLYKISYVMTDTSAA